MTFFAPRRSAPSAVMVLLLVLGLGGCPKGTPADPEPTPSNCPDEQTSCGEQCVDTGSDPRHCGDCDQRCSLGSVCAGGRCTMVGDCNQTACTGFSYCDSGSGLCLPRCTGDGDCLVAQSRCDLASGTCLCPALHHPCPFTQNCVRDDSTAHCGARCEPCPTDPNGVPTCDGMRCGLACNPGFHVCGDRCVRDDAVESCGARCEPCPGLDHGHATCDGGSCGLACESAFLMCSGLCAACPSEAVTAVGCNAASCVATACASGHAACAGQCASCPSGGAITATGCSGAACVATACQAGHAVCAGLCAACPTGGAVTATGCAGSACVATACQAGHAVCQGDCAACPTAAVTATACDGARCVAAACQAGYRTCEGACAACPAAPAGTVFGCDGAACVVSQCPADHLFCGGGCAACPVEGVTATGCEGAACVATACQAGHEIDEGRCKSWSFETVRTTSLRANPDLAVDSTGRLHAVWADYSNGLIYGTDAGGSWAFETVDTVDVRGCAVAVDGLGRPHLAYLAAVSGVDELRYAHRDAGGWTHESALIDGLWSWHGPDLALHSAGLPVIAFTAVSAGMTYDISLARPGPSGWLFEATGYDGFDPRLALDPSDRPHLLFDRQTLYYATRGAGAWSRETVRVGGENRSLAMALDSTGQPRAASLRDLPDEFGYAARSGTVWQTETFPLSDAIDHFGRTRLVLDGDAPVILYAYSVPSNGQRVRLRRGDGAGGWVDRLVFSGTASTGALDLGLRNGEPVLLLHVDGALKVATFE